MDKSKENEEAIVDGAEEAINDQSDSAAADILSQMKGQVG